ncbi:MAG: TonB-dependent receptor [Chitinophagaceae bacterium]
MKLTCSIILLGCLHVSAGVFSQSRISVNFQSLQLKKALAAIEKKSDFRFLYKENLVAESPRITLNMTDAPVTEVLNRILANTGLSYQLMSNNLVVLKTSDKELQDIRITGKVTSTTGEPIAGASVNVKGTSLGVATDGQGNFTITVPDSAVLVISSVGFQTQEVSVNGRTTVDVTLASAESTLDQVVVVGYGTQRRSQISGSVAKVNGTELTKQPLMAATQALQGKAAGVQIIGSGTPGSQPQVRIRGTNTVTGNPNPVYVVDGVITDDITNISTSDIESMEVLKDASSQAIYGSRGSNGVILITTKSGKVGKMRISFDSYVGFRRPTSKVKMADARTYAQYTNESRAYAGQAPAFNLDTLKYNTNWFDEITRNGMVQNHVVSVGGGSEKTTYFFSAGLFKDEGILLGNDFTRGVFRINNEYKLAKFFKLGHNINVSVSKSNNKPNVFSSAYRLAPTVPVKYDNGAYGYTSLISVGNPVASLQYTNSVSNQVRALGNVYAELTPLKGLTLRSSFNFDKYNNNGRDFTPRYIVWSGQQNPDSTILTISQGNGFSYIFDNYATYKTTIADDHELTVTAGYTGERSKYYTSSGTGKGVPNEPNLWYLSQSNPNSRTYTDGGGLTTRASYYGRLSYTYKDKYSVNGIVRRDGSSNFPVNEKWGTFYSAGASWIVTKEKFMEDQHIFDELKLRAGYGKIGNDRIGSQAALYPVSLISNAYSFGTGTSVVPGLTFNQIQNASFSWETTKGIDVGVEFAVLNRRLTGDVAYYNKLTNAYIPVTVGGAFGDQDNVVISQAADVRNKGVEVNLRWSDNIGKEFSYYVGGNITFNTNNVDKVNGVLQLKGGSLGNGQVTTYTVEGQPIGSFWAYQVTGIFRDSTQLLATPRLSGTRPGDLIFQDTNGDKVINDKDKVFVGSYQPKTYYGLSAGFTWRELDFSIDCYGNAGNKVYNGKKAVLIGNDNIEAKRAEGRWTTSNRDNASNPRASSTGPQVSTYYVESGSFFRINNITLGYTLPSKNWNIGMSKLRVYVSAQNPVISKKYSGYTPELPAASAIDQGIELNVYPVTSTYMMGVNVTF